MIDYKPYFALEKKLKEKGFEGDRKDLISQFTEGKKDSLKSLTHWQYKEFIVWLNSFVNGSAGTKQTPEYHQRQLLRRKIIALFHKMHYKLDDGKIDIKRVDEWCLKYGKFKKILNYHTYNELVQLVTQVEKVYETFLKGLE